ncbi:ATP-binding cassette domain-containing protein [Actinomyces respiraculi]|uniref:ATP-binding cassette domain-containing protein n=1 Tax=Actinomyces respiraculi TaxID=2744574 RepID=UPI0022A6C53E|nr:ABC transporter ATP-binding protein [Actinomyces respiraculi]
MVLNTRLFDSIRVVVHRRDILVLTFALLFTVGGDLALVCMPPLVSRAVEVITHGKLSYGDILVLTGVGFVQLLFTSLGGYLIAVCAQTVARRLRSLHLRAYLDKVPFAASDIELSSSDGASRLVVDVATAIDSCLTMLISIVHVSLVGGIAATRLLRIDSIMLALCLTVASMTFVVSATFKGEIDRRLTALKAQQASVLARVAAVLSRSEIALFGATAQCALSRSDLQFRELSSSALRLTRLHYVVSPCVSIITIFGQMTLLLIGASKLGEGSMSFAVFSAAMVYYNLLLPALNSLPDVLVAGVSVSTSLRRLVEFPDRICEGMSDGLDHRQRRFAASQNVIEVLPRDRVVIVGPSGAGKTTLIRAQLGLVPEVRAPFRFLGVHGRGADGDTRWERDSSLYFYAPQVPMLLSSSLSEEFNLESLSDHVLARVSEILDFLDLSHRIERDPTSSYGEFGSELSLGEIQRLTWVRAYLSSASILFFDEPTSSVDSLQGSKFSRFCELYLCDRTIVVAAHADEFDDLKGRRVVRVHL